MKIRTIFLFLIAFFSIILLALSIVYQNKYSKISLALLIWCVWLVFTLIEVQSGWSIMKNRVFWFLLLCIVSGVIYGSIIMASISPFVAPGTYLCIFIVPSFQLSVRNKSVGKNEAFDFSNFTFKSWVAGLVKRTKETENWKQVVLCISLITAFSIVILALFITNCNNVNRLFCYACLGVGVFYLLLQKIKWFKSRT